jgi:DNA-binding response OmpR family regulator
LRPQPQKAETALFGAAAYGGIEACATSPDEGMGVPAGAARQRSRNSRWPLLQNPGMQSLKELPCGPMTSLLLIDDDIRLASMIADYLRENQLTVTHAASGTAALAEIKRQKFDLILLDLMLPDMDGLALFRELMAQPSFESAPVIMLTARGDPMDRVVGLEIGAEDYVAKPFEPRELLARIRVVLRRGTRTPAPADLMRFGRLEIDRGSRLVRVAGEEKPLTSYQFDLLAAMAERAGRVLSRETLANLVRAGHEPYDSSLDRSVDVHIARLRAVLEDDPKHPRRILTVRGAGYVFAKAQS